MNKPERCPNCRSELFDGWECRQCGYSLPIKARKAHPRNVPANEMPERLTQALAEPAAQPEPTWMVGTCDDSQTPHRHLPDCINWIPFTAPASAPQQEAISARDWNHLLFAICDVYALLDKDWADADEGNMDEFDPWDALRKIHSRVETLEFLHQGRGELGQEGQTAPQPMILTCPKCGAGHIDEGEWATRPHKTHQCQSCGHEWRPFEYPTVGVEGQTAELKADHLFGIFCEGNAEKGLKDLGGVTLNWDGWQRVADYANKHVASRLSAAQKEHDFSGANICKGCGHSKGWLEEHAQMAKCDHGDPRDYLLEQQRVTLGELRDDLAAAQKEIQVLRDANEKWVRIPDEQTWYWHWNGKDYAAPHIYSVMTSCSGAADRYFISHPDSRWCDEVGGWWLKIARPNVPSRDYQRAALSGEPRSAK